REGSWRHQPALPADLAALAAGLAGDVGPETLVDPAVDVAFLAGGLRPPKPRLRLLRLRVEGERPLEGLHRERRFAEAEVGLTFDVPKPRSLADPEGPIGPEDGLAVAFELPAEQDAVRHRVEEIRVELQGLVEAPRRAGVIAEAQQGRPPVAPCGRMFRPHREHFVVAGDRAAVVADVVQGGALVDPGLKGSRLDLQQPIVGLDLFRVAADGMKRGGEAEPSLLRLPVNLEGLSERLDRAGDVSVLPEDVSAEQPGGVVLGLQLDRDVIFAQRPFEVPAIERPARGPHRILQAVDRRQEAAGGLRREDGHPAGSAGLGSGFDGGSSSISSKAFTREWKSGATAGSSVSSCSVSCSSSCGTSNSAGGDSNGSSNSGSV